MKTYTITESKAQLSALVKQVMETGEMVVIGKQGEPMVKLTRYQPAPKPPRRLGAFQDEIRIAKDFDEWGGEEARALGMLE